MSEHSKIEWTDHTFNLVWGCVKSTAGCDNCYADTLSNRYGYDVWGPGKPRRTFGPAYWAKPLSWDREARKAGVRRRVFCSSMTDVFLNDPTINAEREKLWPLIRSTPDLDWQILTKHAERIATNLPADWGEGYPNVWLGVSVENDDTRWRIAKLVEVPAAVRFLSVEPMLGPVNVFAMDRIGWVICGGESGHHARPMDLNWARELRDYCRELRIPFFLKQLGGARDKRGHEDAILDGQRWVQFPKVEAA
jgi:protein gp37